jgi:hypothetical protein
MESLFSIIKYLFGMSDRQTDGVGGSKTNLSFLLFTNISVAEIHPSIHICPEERF